MNIKKDWKKTFAIVLFVVLLGGYYDRMSVETQAMILPLMIFIAAGFVIARLKQFEFEISSFKVNAREIMVQSFSVIDSDGRERVSISTTPGTALMTIFDEHHEPRAHLDLLDGTPFFKLEGKAGSARIAFDPQGRPGIMLKDDDEKVIWSAP